MSQQLFRGVVSMMRHNIQPNGNAAAQVEVDLVTLEAESLTGTASAEVLMEGKPFTIWPGPGDEFFASRKPNGAVEIGWQGVVHHDVKVANMSLMHNAAAATRLIEAVAACPEALRDEAERSAESMGVRLEWENTSLRICTRRGAIRKHLDVPGMIEPELGWRKLLVELGLLA